MTLMNILYFFYLSWFHTWLKLIYKVSCVVIVFIYIFLITGESTGVIRAPISPRKKIPHTNLD